MFTDYCCNPSPAVPEPAGVLNIYYVLADDSYDVVHTPITDHWVMLHTIGGSGQLRLERQSYHLTAGDLILFQSPTDFHYACPGPSWEFWWFEFYGACPAAFPPGYHFVPHDATMQMLCRESLRLLKLKDRRAASSLFLACLEYAAAAERHRQEQDHLLSLDRIQQADEYIRLHLRDVTVASLARRLCVHPRTLQTSFLRCAGCSPSRYIRQIRLEYAAYYLQNTTKTIAELSIDLGYSSAFHLSKAFKQHYGASPSEYRKSSSRS